jgi:hypothetical protein
MAAIGSHAHHPFKFINSLQRLKNNSNIYPKGGKKRTCLSAQKIYVKIPSNADKS